MQLAFLVGITALCVTVFVYLWLAGLEKTRQTTILAGQGFVAGTTPVSPSVAGPSPSQAPAGLPPSLVPPTPGTGALSPLPPNPWGNVPPPQQPTPGQNVPEAANPMEDQLDVPVWQRKKPFEEKVNSSFEVEDAVVLQTPIPAIPAGRSYYLIKRRIRITYSRHAHVGKACYISIKIAGDLNDLSVMSRSQHARLQVAPNNWLLLNAQEPEPVLQAELHFADGEFSCSRKVLRQRLLRQAETEFQFVVKPLKDEDCLLTVEIFYIREGVANPAQNDATTIAEKVLLTNLVITATSFFGFHAGQLALVKRLTSVIGVALLVFLAIRDGQFATNCDLHQLNCTTDVGKLFEYAILILANIASVPVLDELKERLTKTRY